MQKPSKVESFGVIIKWDFWFIKMFWENSFTSWITQKVICNFLGRFVRVATNFFLVSFFMFLEKNCVKNISFWVFHQVGRKLPQSNMKSNYFYPFLTGNHLCWGSIDAKQHLCLFDDTLPKLFTMKWWLWSKFQITIAEHLTWPFCQIELKCRI